MKKLWVVCGPTASGKTSLAIAWAQKRNAEILSADSRQIYKELKIGVARPSEEELSQVPHHFIAKVSVYDEFSAGMYANQARSFLESYFRDRDEIVVCGGTGLYIQALLEGIDRLPVPADIREEVRLLHQTGGIELLAARIEEQEPGLIKEGEKANPHRLQRLLEWILAGKPQKKASDWPEEWQVVKMAPDLPREQLYDRINRRVDQMMQDGLWEEAENLLPYRGLNALQTVGYSELFDAMDGLYTKEFAVEKIKQHTRNYAKRQLTWFRKVPDLRWLSQKDQADIMEGGSFSHGSLMTSK